MAITKAVKAAETVYEQKAANLAFIVADRDRLNTIIDDMAVELVELRTSIEELGTTTDIEVFKPKVVVPPIDMTPVEEAPVEEPVIEDVTP